MSTLPLTWWVSTDTTKTLGAAIRANLLAAAARLGAPATTILLHPADLVALGVEIQEDRDEKGKVTKTGEWRGLAVLAIERPTKRGPASPVNVGYIWYGRA